LGLRHRDSHEEIFPRNGLFLSRENFIIYVLQNISIAKGEVGSLHDVGTCRIHRILATNNIWLGCGHEEERHSGKKSEGEVHGRGKGFFIMNCEDVLNGEGIEYAILGVAVAVTVLTVAVAVTVLTVAVAVTVLAVLVLAVAVTVFTTFVQFFKLILQ
jgi:hypothetical protein